LEKSEFANFKTLNPFNAVSRSQKSGCHDWVKSKEDAISYPKSVDERTVGFLTRVQRWKS